MLKYNYRCKNCEDVFEAVHFMSERLINCEKCDIFDLLMKIPSSIAIQYRNKETGKVVDDYIKEAKEEVRQEKENLKTRDYEK